MRSFHVTMGALGALTYMKTMSTAPAAPETMIIPVIRTEGEYPRVPERVKFYTELTPTGGIAVWWEDRAMGLWSGRCPTMVDAVDLFCTGNEQPYMLTEDTPENRQAIDECVKLNERPGLDGQEAGIVLDLHVRQPWAADYVRWAHPDYAEAMCLIPPREGGVRDTLTK